MSDHLSSLVIAQVKAAVRQSWPIVLAVAVTLAHLLIAARSMGPMYLLDEVGYLAAAENIARGETDWALCGESYSVGWSLVLAPLWWLPLSPVIIYQIAALASAAVGAAVMWPATLLARELGATRGVSFGIGALVTLVPTRALMDNYVIAENLLTFAIVYSVLLAFRVHTRGTLGVHIAFGLSVGAAALTHSRAMPFVIVAVVWLGVRALVRDSALPRALAGALPAVALAITGFSAQMALGASLFIDDQRIEKLLGGRELSDVTLVVVGQVFSPVVSWSLFVTLGAIAIIASVRSNLRNMGRKLISSPYAWWGLAFASQAIFTVFVLSGFESIDTRLDVPLYGRYLDPFLVPIAILGITSLLSNTSKRAIRIALISALVAIALYLVAVWPFVADDAAWIYFATPGFLPYLDPYEGPKQLGLLIAAGIAALSCVVIFLLRRHAVALLSLALVITASISLVTDMARLDPFEANVRAQTPISKWMDANALTPDIATLSPIPLPCAERNKLQFELASMASIVQAPEAIGRGIAVGPAVWPEAESSGFLRIMFTVWENSAIWAIPADS